MDKVLPFMVADACGSLSIMICQTFFYFRSSFQVLILGDRQISIPIHGKERKGAQEDGRSYSQAIVRCSSLILVIAEKVEIFDDC